jgi:hypothetical protein
VVKGGMLQPASGVTVTINGFAEPPGDFQWVDESLGGTVVFNTPVYNHAWKGDAGGNVFTEPQTGPWLDDGGEVVNIRPYVVGDGVADDTAGLTAAVAAAVAKRVLLRGPADLTLRLTDTVNMTGVRFVDMESIILVDHDEIGVIAGDSSITAFPIQMSFARVSHISGINTVPDEPLLRFKGMKNARVKVRQCAYVQLYANHAVATETSISYSSFHWGTIRRLELYGEPGGQSWINECDHYGGRITTLVFDGEYPHNNHVFHKPCIEGGSSLVHFKVGVNNHLRNVRTEGGMQVVFEERTYHNIVDDGYVSGPQVVAGSAVVTDHGYENVCTSFIQRSMDRRILWGLGAGSNQILGPAADFPSDNLPIPNADGSFYGLISASSVVDVTVDLEKLGRRFRFASDATIWRSTVTCYDENGDVVPAALSGIFDAPMGGPGWVVSGDNYSFGANVASAWYVFWNPTVTSARIRLSCGSSGRFEQAVLEAYAPHTSNDRHFRAFRDSLIQPLVLHTNLRPASGVPKVGQVVRAPNGGWVADARIDTTTTSPVTSGTISSVPVAVDTARNGDVIGLLQTNGRTHWTRVRAGGGTTSLTLYAATTADIASGAAVAIVRWEPLLGAQVVRGRQVGMSSGVDVVLLTVEVDLPATSHVAHATIEVLYSSQVYRATSTRDSSVRSGKALLSISRFNESGSTAAVAVLTLQGTEVQAGVMSNTIALSAAVVGVATGTQTVELRASITTGASGTVAREMQFEARALLDAVGHGRIRILAP